MFWKYNSLSTSQIDALLDRAIAAKTASQAAAAAAAATPPPVADADDAAPDPDGPGGDPEVATDAEGDGDPEASPEAERQETSAPEEAPVTLKDILEQEDVIQECKNQNKKLVEYLCNNEILSELLSLITVDPPTDLDDALRFKLPHIAAEVLTCEVAQINEAISADDKLLAQLYSFMERPPPLNPLLASFFSRAFGVLITRKSEQNWYNYQYNCIQVFEFLKKMDLVQDLLRHIGTSAISDLILRLITCVEGTDIKQNLLDWLNEKQLIQSIIGLLDPSLPRDTHDNASRLLIEILRVSRDGQFVPANERCDDPLLNTMEDPATVQLLLNVMFREGATSESSLVNGISILLVLLESRRPQQIVPTNIYSAAAYNAAVSGSDPEMGSPEEVEKQQRILDATIQAILPRMKAFTDLLVNPPVKPAIKSTAGVLDPPLGATRLNIAKLISALLSTNSMDVNCSLKEHRTIDILLDLFFKYSLNNFLHSQVEQCVSHVFEWKQIQKFIPASIATPPTVPTSPKNNSENEEEESEEESKMETELECKPAEVETEQPMETQKEKMETDLESKTAEIDPAQPMETQEEKMETEMDLKPAEIEAAQLMETQKEQMETELESKPVEGEMAQLMETQKGADAESEKKGESPGEEREAAKSQPPYNNPLLTHLLSHSRLVERILAAWEENEGEGVKAPEFRRKGYMGHLTRIANIMVQHSEKSDCKDLILEQLRTLPESTGESWEKFVKGQLAEMNAKNFIVPASSYANPMSSSEDGDADFRDLQFPQESALQQMFSDYQMQQMSEHFIDSFGFGAEDLSDNDSDGAAAPKRFTTISFGLEDDDSSAANTSMAMFESECNQRFHDISN